MKGEIVPVHVVTAYKGSGGILPLIRDLTLEGGNWSASRSGQCVPRTHCIADSVGHRTGRFVSLFE